MVGLWELFRTFFQIGICSFGGGYAMLGLLTRELVGKRAWVTEEELMDYYAIGQCTPGIIAINTATFIGNKLRKIPGAIAATFGFLAPSILIITVIAAFLSNFAELPVVVNAFNGIRVCVFVLIVDAVWKLGKKAVVSPVTAGIFLVVMLLSLFKVVSTVVLVVLSGIAGYILYLTSEPKKTKKEGEKA